MPGPGTIPVDNETVSRTSRKTRDGRTLSYKLTVLQSPDRARACGSGAKSQTDRRPVDPPPILELRIFEGEEDQLKDVTFTIDANYMLYVGLEQSRFQAPCRGTQPQEPKPTIMHCAGQGVSGLTLLERPNPAGYFLFPDISVRHEGSYRLNFNLFEVVKHPEDEDPDLPGSQSGRESAVHRMEVKSLPFTVYSAKKFPGLKLSTELSRCIADQGCRVRIRRDVRMRKRGPDKAGKDYDPYDDDNADARGRVSATPESSGYHAMPFMGSGTRRTSSDDSRRPSLAPLSRRTSFQDISPALPSPYGAAPHHAYSQPYVHETQTHPAFSQSQTYAPAVQPHSPAYPPAHTTQTLPAPAPPPSSYGYGPPPPVAAAPPSSFETTPYHRRSSAEYTSPSAHRRPSSVYSSGVQSPQTYSTYQQPPTYSSSHARRGSFSSTEAYSRAAPAEPVQPPIRNAGAVTPLVPSRSFEDKKLPPLNTTYSSTPANGKYIEPASPAGPPPPTQQPHSYPTPVSVAALDSNKRAYSQVFNERHLSGPMRQGSRPTPATYSSGPSPSAFSVYTAVEEDAEPDGGFDLGEIKMSYRRADGRTFERTLPVQG